MFLFDISNYDDPALDVETAELLHQRLEAHSRRAMPEMWKMTDRLNGYAAKGSSREKQGGRHRVYGVILLALGIFVLVPGLMNPRTHILIWVGGFVVAYGLFKIWSAREKKPLKTPAACQKEAEQLLAGRRAVDWTKTKMQVSFDETGMTVFHEGNQETVPYVRIENVFETARLWLLIYDGEKALLLQKKDLISGAVEDFSSFLAHLI